MPSPLFFEPYEFACRCGCGADSVAAALVVRLDALRALWGSPVYVTSGRRCPKHNAAVQGSANSRHLIGCAADIRPEEGADFERFIASALVFFSPPLDEFLVYRGARFLHVAVARGFENPGWNGGALRL